MTYLQKENRYADNSEDWVVFFCHCLYPGKCSRTAVTAKNEEERRPGRKAVDRSAYGKDYERKQKGKNLSELRMGHGVRDSGRETAGRIQSLPQLPLRSA